MFHFWGGGVKPKTPLVGTPLTDWFILINMLSQNHITITNHKINRFFKDKCLINSVIIITLKYEIILQCFVQF